MNRAAEAMGDIVHRFISRVPDMDEGLAIDWVLDAAQDYVDGKLPWYEAAKIGAVTRIDWRTGRDIESAAYTRFLAVVFAKPSDRLYGVVTHDGGPGPRDGTESERSPPGGGAGALHRDRGAIGRGADDTRAVQS